MFGGILINQDNIGNSDYCRLYDHVSIGVWGKENRRMLSMSDNGKQPNNEWMLSVCFPSGAYILSKEYVKDVFDDFFNEILKFNAAFVDTTNHNVLFYPKDAKAIYDALPSLITKYRELAQLSAIDAKRERLQKELAELDNR